MRGKAPALAPPGRNTVQLTYLSQCTIEDFLANPEHVLQRIASSANLPSPGGRGAAGEGVAVYRDIPGFCKATRLADIRGHSHVLTPGRYVGAEAAEDDGEPFEEKMQRLTAQLAAQMAESAGLDDQIRKNLEGLGYGF
jgi:type I restriction enzyme M protein